MESELSTATNVPVKLGDRSYEIVIAPGALDEVASTIAATVSISHLLVVSDSNVAPKGKKGTQRTKLNIDSSCLSLSVFWMPRCPRLCPAGTCFHVINRAVARLTLFEKQEDYVAFERAVKLTHERVPLPIYACCRIIGISWFSRKPIRWLLSSFAG